MFLWTITQAVVRDRLQKDLEIGCREAALSAEERAQLSAAVARSVDSHYHSWIRAADEDWLADPDVVRALAQSPRDGSEIGLAQAIETLLLHGPG